MASSQRSQQPHPDEDRLIREAQAGNRPAFAALVDHYWQRLYRWLYRLANDRHTAEDLAQETFLRAFQAIPRFRPGSDFGAWLFRIAHNLFANHCRARKRQRPALPAVIPDRAREPLEEVVGQEDQAAIAAALLRLPADFRGALLLRVEEGLSFRQIAQVLGLTEETARWRVYKARQKLLELLPHHREQELS